ncbi:hypothetical protein [Alteromonas gilva]|uniref:Uncharacterized protein n=1 Tax=Alteromonas gilva TaxID=2987522 RepID=A0ABT5L0H2_9ALTE|nr:hypothetical protein [Alteromonas gilva]MDC8830387.1 hypothetical protein [Alteromonas gilva]
MSATEKQATLVTLCHTLAAQGQTPGVGLLRSKAPFKVTVLDAIEAIKTFNQQYQAAPSPADISDKEKISQLEKRVKQLEDALVVMESRLAKWGA